MRPILLVGLAVGAALAVLVGFHLSGGAPATEDAPSAAPSERPEAASASRRDGRIRPAVRLRAAVPEPAEANVAAPVVRQLLANVAASARTSDSPESTLNAVREYLRGMSDAIKSVAPQLQPELSAALNAALCESGTSEAETLALSEMARFMPGLLNTRGVDCVLERTPGENAVLWGLLDAWRLTGLPKTERLAEWQRRAVDPRTLRRFMSFEEEHELRARATNVTASAGDRAKGEAR